MTFLVQGKQSLYTQDRVGRSNLPVGVGVEGSVQSLDLTLAICNPGSLLECLGNF